MKTPLTKEINSSHPSRASSGKREEPFFPPAAVAETPSFGPATIQTKLTIGQPNDKYEQEADAMAERVSRMPMSAPLQTKPIIQRQETEEDEEHVQAKPLMLKATGGESVATPALTQSLASSKGGGYPLPAGTHQFMNQAFGQDFGSVRVHTDDKAVQMNQGLQARAFTHGSDIYFNQGQYSPESAGGRKLLAHELTHVVQQGGVQPRLQPLRFSNNGVEFDYTINMTRPCFNSGPGRVGIDAERTIAAMSQPFHQKWLRFYSGSPASGADPCAWRFTPELEFGFQTAASTQPSGHQIGFIQTTEQIRYEANYANLSPYIMNVTNARDAAHSSVAAPWFNSPGQFCGPVDAWNSPNSPEIEDMPFAVFRVWGHQSREENPLQSVNASGTFHIWLVLKHPNDPGDQLSSLNFLYHLTINYNRSWNFQGQYLWQRDSPSSWRAIGSQHISAEGEGRGAATPVLSGPIANEQLNQQALSFQYPA